MGRRRSVAEAAVFLRPPGWSCRFPTRRSRISFGEVAMGNSIACRLAAAALALCLLSAGALAKTLPLPDGLVGLNSAAGETLLLHSTARQAYWNLSLQFVTQKTQTYCGIAS